MAEMITPTFVRLVFDGSMDVRCPTCIAIGGNRRCLEYSKLFLQIPTHVSTIGDLSQVLINDFGLSHPINLCSGEYLLQRSTSVKILDLFSEVVRVVESRDCRAPLLATTSSDPEISVPVPDEGGLWHPVASMDQWNIPIPTRIQFDYEVSGSSHNITLFTGDLLKKINELVGVKDDNSNRSGSFSNVRIWSDAKASSLSDGTSEMVNSTSRDLSSENCSAPQKSTSLKSQEDPRFFPIYASTPVCADSNGVDSCSVLIRNSDDNSETCGSVYVRSQSQQILAQNELLNSGFNKVVHDPEMIAHAGANFEEIEVNESMVDTTSEAASKREITAVKNPQDVPIPSLGEQVLLSISSGPASDAGQSSDKIKMDVYSSCRKRKRENTLSSSESVSSVELTPPKKQITVDQSALFPIEDQPSTSTTGSLLDDIDYDDMSTEVSDDSLREEQSAVIKTEISRTKRKIDLLNSNTLSTSESSKEIVTPTKKRKTEEGEDPCFIDTPTPKSGLTLNRFRQLSVIQRFQLNPVPGDEGHWLSVASLDSVDIPIGSRLRFEYQVRGSGHDIVPVQLVGDVMCISHHRLGMKILSEDGKSTSSNARGRVKVYTKSSIANAEIWSDARASSSSSETSDKDSSTNSK